MVDALDELQTRGQNILIEFADGDQCKIITVKTSLVASETSLITSEKIVRQIRRREGLGFEVFQETNCFWRCYSSALNPYSALEVSLALRKVLEEIGYNVILHHSFPNNLPGVWHQFM